MHRLSRPGELDLTSAQDQADYSPPHDRMSMSPSYSLMPAPVVNPDPVYIAVSAASQIVTSEHQSQYRDSLDGREGYSVNDTALVSASSLNLVNAFLDRLLFNFLASARSTSLGSLRPAVAEVLKPRLAKEAITGADEELQEFLGGGDDEELLAFHNGQEPSGEWDLDLVWKRTRLRCMVYTHLGDMEEEDEEMYIEQENLEDTSGSRRVSRDLGIVSPAAAIFLTSILEFIGEQALMIAGEAAYARMENDFPRSEKRKSSTIRRVVVEEIDMEKVAFNTTLGRLWRSWRRLVRSPKSSVSRSIAQDMSELPIMLNQPRRSSSRERSPSSLHGQKQKPALAQTSSAAGSFKASGPESIPLPSTDHDVAEIEVPGYSPLAIRRVGRLSAVGHEDRPHSMVLPPESRDRLFTPTSSQSQSPVLTQGTFDDDLDHIRHHRSHSLPTPTQTPLVLARQYQSPVVHVSSSPKSLDFLPLPTGVSTVHGQDLTSRTESGCSNSNLTANVERSVSGTPNPNSTSTYQGSVLNVISQYAARELDSEPRTAAVSRKHPPDLLEEDKLYEWNTASVPTIEDPTGTTVRRRLDSSNSIQTFAIGDVSPMVGEFSLPGEMSIESGEVSPIDPSEDDQLYASEPAPFNSDALSGRGNQDYAIPTILDSEREDISIESVRHNLHPATGRQRRLDGPTSDDITKEDNREAYVVIDDLPLSQSVRTSNASTLSGRDLQVDGTIINRRAQNSGPDVTFTSLTPLREMKEATQDNSDQGSSSVLGQIVRLQSTLAAQATPPPLSLQPQARKLPGGNQTANMRHQLPPVNTSTGNGTGRAAVQRVSPSHPPTRDPDTPQGRRSDSSSRELRPIHTSTSSTSPVSQRFKGLVGRQHGEDNRERIPSRASSDGGRSAHGEKNMLINEDPNNKQKSFEQLIRSDETIQYTLTPQNMREIEAPDFGRWSSSKRANSTQGSNHNLKRGTSASGHSSQTSGWSAVASPEKLNGLRSNPIASRLRSPSDTTTIVTSARSNLPTASGTKGRRADQPVPRDARVEHGTTKDFADFIRSTGPEQVKFLPKVPTSLSTTTSRPNTAISGTLRSPGATGPRTLTKSPSGKGHASTAKRAEVRASKNIGARLQARDATINRSDESSDLIDFIRQGPPVDHSDGGHRIPRTVAPFRTTKDSDEMHDLVHGRYKDTSSVASTQDSSGQTKSLHSSINSRTGLLDSTNKSSNKLGNAPTSEQPSHVEKPPHPMRKQRRAKDPYAIDIDSDSDNEVKNTRKPREEESLLDFLNSEPPPSQGVIVPSAFDNMPNPSGKTLQRKVSAPSMRARFARSGSSPPSQTSAARGAPTTSQNAILVGQDFSSTSKHPHRGVVISPNPRTRNEIQPSHSANLRDVSPHLIPKPVHKLDNYKPTQPTYASHVDHQRYGATRNGAKPGQARVERSEGDNMRDLADFLMNSSPPETARPISPDIAKEKSGFSRMFSGRKKSIGLA